MSSWLGRIGWLVLIWSLSVLALGVVAVMMHGIMDLAGLKAS
jgi:hypothetical protein